MDMTALAPRLTDEDRRRIAKHLIAHTRASYALTGPLAQQPVSQAVNRLAANLWTNMPTWTRTEPLVEGNVDRVIDLALHALWEGSDSAAMELGREVVRQARDYLLSAHTELDEEAA